MVFWNVDIADRTIISFDLGDKDDPISVLWCYAEPEQLVLDIHPHLSMSIAVIGVVDRLPEYFVVEGII